MTKTTELQSPNFSIHRFMVQSLGLSGVALLVYAYIFSFSVHGRYCYASMEKIADEIGSSAASVKRAINSLVEKNYLEKESQDDFRTNRYYAKRNAENSPIPNQPGQNEPGQNDLLDGSKCTAEWLKMSYNNKDTTKVITSSSIIPPERERKREIAFLRYGHEQLVMMTQKQYSDLKQRLGSDTLGEYIVKLESYMLLYPDRYVKNHYETILRWARQDANTAE